MGLGRGGKGGDETNEEAGEPLDILPRSFSIADVDTFVRVGRVVVLEELTTAGGEIGAATSVLALMGGKRWTRFSSEFVIWIDGMSDRMEVGLDLRIRSRRPGRW